MWCCRNHLWKVTQQKMYSGDEGAESKQQSRGSFINAKQKAAAAAPRICSSAESESVRSCCGTHVGMCPACVSVLHPQGSLVHFCFVFFELIFRVLKRWACPLLTESSLSWCEGRALVFWVWRRNGWCRHEWDKSKRVLLLCWKYKLICEYRCTQTEKKKGSRVSKMSEYGLACTSHWDYLEYEYAYCCSIWMSCWLSVFVTYNQQSSCTGVSTIYSTWLKVNLGTRPWWII